MNLLNWETLTLNDIARKNPNETTAQCLDVLIKQMTTIQRNLPAAYHHDKLLCDKLINACRSNEACKFVCYKASNTLTDVISDLQSSIVTYGQPNQPGVYHTDYGPEPDDEADAYYTDRRYQGLSRNPSRFRPKQQPL